MRSLFGTGSTLAALLLFASASVMGCEEDRQADPPPAVGESYGDEFEGDPSDAPPAAPPAEEGAPEPGAPAPGAAEPGAAEPGAPMGPGARAEPPSDQELEEFSKVQVQLLTLQQSYAQRAQAGEQPQALQAELQEKAGELIEESDLTVSRFEQIGSQAQHDADLRSQIEARMSQQIQN